MSERLEKLAKVAALIGKLPKDKRNKHSGYDYLSEEAVKTAINHNMPEAGVWHEGIRFEILSDEWVKGKQAEQNLVKIRCVIPIAGHEYEGLGAGIDYGDKALLKAQTSAVREAWKNVFVIAGGGDPEADERANEERVQSRSEEPSDPEDAVCPIGKNKGKRWRDLPTSSVQWYAKDCKHKGARDAAQRVMEARKAKRAEADIGGKLQAERDDGDHNDEWGLTPPDPDPGNDADDRYDLSDEVR